MDWARAKNILIICFLAGNVILSYQLWMEHRHTAALDDILPRIEREVDGLQEQLQEKGLRLETGLPTETPRLYPLRLARHDPDVEQLRDAFFAEREAESVIVGGRLSGYQSDEAVLVVGGSGTIRFRQSIADAGEDLEARDAINLAESLLTDERVGPAGVKYDYWQETRPGHYLVYFYQQYRDLPVYGGGVMVKIEGDQIREYQCLWYEVLGPTLQARTVISASRAVSSNLPRIAAVADEQEGAAITEVSLGYYAGVSPEDEEVAHPVWRIRLDDGELLFINAFTGAMEWPQ